MSRLGKFALALPLLSLLLFVACSAHLIVTGTGAPYQDATPEQAAYERFHNRIAISLILGLMLSILASLLVGMAWVVRWFIRKLRSRSRAAPFALEVRMSLVELIPTISSLSRSDKLRLIQWLAGDLAGTEDASLNPANRMSEAVEEDDAEIREDERVQSAVRSVGFCNAIGRMEEEIGHDPGKLDPNDIDQVWSALIESGQSLPIWFPNESYEAAAIDVLESLLELRKIGHRSDARSRADSRFVERDPNLGSVSLAPFLPIELIGKRSLGCLALLDTGAAVNVLPYSIGDDLGAVWDREGRSLPLVGNLAGIETRPLRLSVRVGDFPVVQGGRLRRLGRAPTRSRSCSASSTSSCNLMSASTDLVRPSRSDQNSTPPPRTRIDAPPRPRNRLRRDRRRGPGRDAGCWGSYNPIERHFIANRSSRAVWRGGSGDRSAGACPADPAGRR